MWQTFKELRAAEMAESNPGPSRPPEAIMQASRLPDSISFNGVQYVRGDNSAARD
jgi:hypothetical protein